MLTINDLSVSKKLDTSEMSAVRGGEPPHACGSTACYTSLTVAQFTDLANSGALDNPTNLIAAAAMVRIP